jgi:cytochrome c oxidase subunit 4
MAEGGAGTLVRVWVALLALLAASVATAYVDLGIGNAAVNLGAAALKALLVGLFFMHLRGARPVLAMAAAIGILWLGLLFALSLADLLTRG